MTEKFNKDRDIEANELKHKQTNFDVLRKISAALVVFVVMGLFVSGVMSVLLKTANDGEDKSISAKSKTGGIFTTGSNNLVSDPQVSMLNQKLDDADERLVSDLAKDAAKLGSKSTKTLMDSSNSVSFDPKQEFKEIISLSPVTIFTTDDEEASRLNFKKILTQYIEIIPQPTVVSLSKHPHSAELISYINELIATDYSNNYNLDTNSFLPGIFIGGKPIANSYEIEELFSNDKLTNYLKVIGNGMITVDQVDNHNLKYVKV